MRSRTLFAMLAAGAVVAFTPAAGAAPGAGLGSARLGSGLAFGFTRGGFRSSGVFFGNTTSYTGSRTFPSRGLYDRPYGQQAIGYLPGAYYYGVNNPYGACYGYSGYVISQTAFQDSPFSPPTTTQQPPAPETPAPTLPPPLSDAEINSHLADITARYGSGPAAPPQNPDALINARLARISQAHASTQLPAQATVLPPSTPPVAPAVSLLRLSGFLAGARVAGQSEDFRHLHRLFLWNEGHILILADDDLSLPSFGSAPDGASLSPYGDTFDPSVIAQVQRVLQAQGYYQGPADGAIELGLRRSIGDYQFDHKLTVTGVIDEATLASMGLLRGASLIDQS